MGYKQKCWSGYQMVGMKEKAGKGGSTKSSPKSKKGEY